MSQELYQLLHDRARLGARAWPMGLAASLGLHGLLLGAIFIGPKTKPPEDNPKVTWVTLPAQAGGGASGGSEATELGEEGERLRRVEEVAPQSSEKGGAFTPNAFGSGRSNPAKGTNPDPTSLGKSPQGAKSSNPSPNLVPGAAGQGGGSSLGVGSGVPGLKASNGAQGGVGLIGDLDGAEFPFVTYLRQVQERITGNWYRMSGSQGRVQIYFRIRRDGSIEGARVEITSGIGALDQSALLAVRRSEPLPRLPDGFEGPTLGVRFWFSYVAN